MTTSIYKIDELIQDTPAGKSLNPRATFGWNDELANIVNNQAIAYTPLKHLSRMFSRTIRFKCKSCWRSLTRHQSHRPSPS